MDKTPLEMAEAYAKGNEAIQDAYADGFVAGISFEIERRTKSMMDEWDKTRRLEEKAQEVWVRATGKHYD